MLRRLPIVCPPRTSRLLARDDLDSLAGWPGYPAPYERFDLGYSRMNAAERDALFASRVADRSCLPLVLDHASQPCVGYLVLVEIDWARGWVGNMGFRIHPGWCGQGLGTWMMRAVLRMCFAEGFERLRLDVAASNPRAIRCYVKCGFTITGTFWRDAPDLAGEDLDAPRHARLRGHVRLDGAVPQGRFWWMEARRPAG